MFPLFDQESVRSRADATGGCSRSRRDVLAEISSGDPSADFHDARRPGASSPGREGAGAGAAIETETARLGDHESRFREDFFASRGGSSAAPAPARGGGGVSAVLHRPGRDGPPVQAVRVRVPAVRVVLAPSHGAGKRR